MFNRADVVVVLVIWRSPAMLNHELGAKKVILDLHDVVPEQEFTAERLARVDKIMVKTKAHRSLFPDIPDDKFAIIPNGQDNYLFKGGVKKDPYLIINTSSPATALATADTETPSWLAASVKLPLSATLTNASIPRSLFKTRPY